MRRTVAPHSVSTHSQAGRCDYSSLFASIYIENFLCTGHENPYAIKMSEHQNDAFMALGPSNYTAYLNIQKVIQDMQAPHVPGKLILKPKESPRDHQQRSEYHPFKFSYSMAFKSFCCLFPGTFPMIPN